MSKECLQCGEDNIDLAAKCINCGFIFTDMVSDKFSDADTKASTPVLVLTDLNSDKVIEINTNCTIGRRGNVDTEFFAEDRHISEYHCRVILENSDYKIEHLPTATNPTKINDVCLSKGIRYLVRDHDYLSIADKIFEVQLKTTVTPVTAEREMPTSINKYIITCPKCGTIYEVDDIDKRIDECNYCDEYDKNEIAKERARVTYAN